MFIVGVTLVFLGFSDETAGKIAGGVGIILFILTIFGSVSNWIKGKGVYYNTCPHCKMRVNVKASVCPHCGRDLT